MKKILMALIVMAGSLTMVVPEAEAKRMGGGRSSFGKQSQSFQKAAPPQQSRATNTAAPAGAAGAAKPSMMRNILGGALLGLGLGALLSHFGIGGALASMISTFLMIALLVFAVMFIVRMIRNRQNGGAGAHNRQPAFSNGYGDSGMAKSTTPEIGSGIGSSASSAPAGLHSASTMSSSSDFQGQGINQIPDDFDVPAFVRNAKTYFIRLQAAWDKADINDIRDFTTPEMFAELRLQLQERGEAANQTDVVSLDGELYGVETVGDEYIASIKFSGMIREDGGAAEPFTEAWNLAKPVSGNGGWVLAGIQQLP